MNEKALRHPHSNDTAEILNTLRRASRAMKPTSEYGLTVSGLPRTPDSITPIMTVFGTPIDADLPAKLHIGYDHETNGLELKRLSISLAIGRTALLERDPIGYTASIYEDGLPTSGTPLERDASRYFLALHGIDAQPPIDDAIEYQAWLAKTLVRSDGWDISNQKTINDKLNPDGTISSLAIRYQQHVNARTPDDYDIIHQHSLIETQQAFLGDNVFTNTTTLRLTEKDDETEPKLEGFRQTSVHLADEKAAHPPRVERISPHDPSITNNFNEVMRL